jgi:hypothetical protein
LKLGAAKGSRATRLERTTKQELRRQKRRELHIKGSARCGHVVCIRRRRLVLVHGLGVEGWDVPSAWVTVSKPGYVGRKCTMGESGITVGRL